MNEPNTTRIVKSLLLCMLVLALIGIGFKVYESLGFRVTGTTPSVHNVATVTSSFTISFNKVVSPKNLSVSSSPKNIINSYKVSGKALAIRLVTPLQASQKYTITIVRIYDGGGRVITNKQLSFTSKFVAWSQLPKTDQQAQLNAQTQYAETAGNDSFLQLLPFIGPGYTYEVIYTPSPGETKPSITITAPTTQAQQSAITWMQGLSFSPSNYNIIYSTKSVQP